MPTYEATRRDDEAIAAVCKAGKKPSRANVLAAIKTTNSPTTARSGSPITFKSNGDLAGNVGYLFHINSAGKYIRDPEPRDQLTD